MGEKIELLPSIASADQLCLREEIERIGGWKRLHIDIEDGNFVPNITFGSKMVKSIAQIASQELDVHLLVKHPEEYFDLIREIGAKNAAIHLESTEFPLVMLNRLKKARVKAGLALNFKTSAEAMRIFRNAVDYVLVMTAEPDDDGQQFCPVLLDKIRELRSFLPPDVRIWADGGICEDNMEEVIRAGADTLVMGRCVFSGKDPFERLCRMSLRAQDIKNRK